MSNSNLSRRAFLAATTTTAVTLAARLHYVEDVKTTRIRPGTGLEALCHI